MSSPAHAPRGTPSDSLLMQVNMTNVLQVRNVLHKQEVDIRTVLQQSDQLLDLRPPGLDPVSGQAAPAFRERIQQIKDVHWAHVRELEEATKRLRDAALHYGMTDDEIDASFRAHDEAVGPIAVDR